MALLTQCITFFLTKPLPFFKWKCGGFVTDQWVWGCLSAAELNKGHRGILTIPEPPINHPLPSHSFLKRLIQPLSPTESPWFTSSIEHRARVMILCWWCWHFFAYVLLLPSLLSPSKMCCNLIHSAILQLFPLLTLLQHWTENWVCKFTAINILFPVDTLLICLTISVYDTRIPLKCTFFPPIIWTEAKSKLISHWAKIA